jgi:excisionase family DNA binding protein
MYMIIPGCLIHGKVILDILSAFFEKMASKKRTGKKQKGALSASMFELAQKSDVDDLISVQEAARLRGVSAASIFQLIARGRLRSEKLIGRTLVYRSEIKNFEQQKPGVKPKKQGSPTRRRSAN